MYYLTHLVFSGVVTQGAAVLVGQPTTLIIGSMLGSILPDIDQPKSYIGKRIPVIPGHIHKRWGHRTITHSALYMLVTAFITLPLCLINRPISGCHLWLGFNLGSLSHILIDMLNPAGVAILYPNIRRFKLIGTIEVKSKRELLLAICSVIVFFCLYAVNMGVIP